MSADDDRARRIAAIQARLAPPPPEPDAEADSGGSGGSGTASPQFRGAGAPRHLAKAWSRPSEREETEKRREMARIVQRTIVRDSGYAQAATCVETLLKIATNIQNNPDPKFRTLKGDNATLKSKVFSIPGGREFMIMMGFRTETRNFVQTFILDQSDRRMYELGLAADVLKEALPDLQARVAGTNLSKTSHKAEEAARVALAKRQIEEDRALVADRVNRERIGRDARLVAEAQAEAARRAKEAAEEEEEARKRERREARERAGGGRQTKDHPQAAVNMSIPAGGGAAAGVGAVAGATSAGSMTVDDLVNPNRPADEAEEFEHEYAEDDGEEEVDSDEGYWNQHRWGHGSKLGE